MWSATEHRPFLCNKVTDAGISALGAGCCQLQSINLSYCDKVTDISISACYGS